MQWFNEKRAATLLVLLFLLFSFFLLTGCEVEERYVLLTMELKGEGSVVPPTGHHEQKEDTLVSIEATPHKGWYFKEWVGDVADPQEKTTTVLMDEDKTIKALFEEEEEYFHLEVTIVGEGSVDKDPLPTNGGYEEGTSVILQAIASEGWEFEGWIGDVEDLRKEEITITMDSDKSIMALFIEESDSTPVTLTMEKEGEGTLDPPLGDHSVTQDMFVDVKATPHKGWIFKEWVGDVEKRELDETRIFMDGDKTVRALFEEKDKEEVQEIVGEEGGTVRLPDGTRLVFPPQAVSEEVLITLSLKDPSSYVVSDLYEAVVLDIQSPVMTFSEPVEIRIPLPEEAPTEIEYFLAGFYEEAGGNIVYHDEELPLQVVEEENGYELVATTLHFSRPVFQWIREWWEGVPEEMEFTLPYYNQGATEYCWAVCLQMVTDSFVPIEEHREEIWRIINDLGISEVGVDGHSFRYSQEIEDIVEQRVGVNPERRIWYISTGQSEAPFSMVRYIRQELSRGRPVILFSAPKGHAFTLIGYNSIDDTYTVHDPASGPPAKIMTSEELGIKSFGGIPVIDFFITLVVPEELPLHREAVTVNIPHNATLFFRQPRTTLHQSNVYRFHWDYESVTGYSFKDLDGIPYGISYSNIPGQTREVLFNGLQGRGFEVANAWDSSVDVEMRMAITPEMHTEPIYEVTEDLSLSGHTLKSGVNPGEGTIPLKEFRLPGPEVYRYEMSIEVLEGGHLVNQKKVYFDLDPAIPYIQDLEVEWPEEEEDPVTFYIHGWNFLAEQRESKVLFHETVVHVLEWSDELLVVKVPKELIEEKEDIDVLVTVDTIESNPYPWSATYTLTVELEGDEEEVSVTPSIGRHRYTKNTQVDLKASIQEHHDRWEFLAWEGDVEDPYSKETTILVDEDKRVKALFEGKPVYILPPRSVVLHYNEEYTRTFEAITKEPGNYRFEWDFDDDSPIVTDSGETSTVTHTYEAPGPTALIIEKNPTVRLYNEKGDLLGEDEVSVTWAW